MTDDIVMLSQMRGKIDALAEDMGEMKISMGQVNLLLAHQNERLGVVERGNWGGAWGKIAERIIIAVLTVVLGATELPRVWRNIADPTPSAISAPIDD